MTKPKSETKIPVLDDPEETERRRRKRAADAARAKRYRERKKRRERREAGLPDEPSDSDHSSGADTAPSPDADDQQSQNARPVETTALQRVTPNEVRETAKRKGSEPKEDDPERDVRQPNPTRVEEEKRRIDGKLQRARLSPEFKAAVQEAYSEDLGIDFRALSAATGVSLGALWRAVQEAPRLAERARENRQRATVEDLEAGLALLAKRFRERAEAGDLDPTAKTMRDFAIMFGVMTDKRQLLTGKATANVAVRAHMTIEERKQRLRDVLDRAKTVVAHMDDAKGKP